MILTGVYFCAIIQAVQNKRVQAMADNESKVVFTAEDQVRFRVQGSGKLMSELYRRTMGLVSTGGLWSYDGEEEGVRIFEFSVPKSESDGLILWLQEKGAIQKSNT
jgi:hypothetical protein